MICEIRRYNKETGVAVRYGNNISEFCGVCGSGEYMTNEDENKNNYCGQCGTTLDWENMINIDEEDADDGIREDENWVFSELTDTD